MANHNTRINLSAANSKRGSKQVIDARYQDKKRQQLREQMEKMYPNSAKKEAVAVKKIHMAKVDGRELREESIKSGLIIRRGAAGYGFAPTKEEVLDSYKEEAEKNGAAIKDAVAVLKLCGVKKI